MVFQNKYAIYSIIMALMLAMPAYAVYPQSPSGCTADNSVVNIAVNTVSATPGQTVTFTVEAGNPASGNGCDIRDRTMTLTLPDSSTHVFGPNNYPNPSALAIAGSADYVANVADVVGGVWTATVTWNGTLTNGNDKNSTGSKGADVVYVPVNLEVTKTAQPRTETTYSWSIDKSVSPATWNLFDGDTGTSDYNVSVVKGQPVTSNSVSGVITIYNPSQYANATITNVTDIISGPINANVVCGVSFPYTLGPGATLLCNYTSALPDNSTRTNDATVTTSGQIGGDSGTAPVDFANAIMATTLGSINVTDTNGGSWQFGDSGSVTYNKTFDCSAVEYDNGHATYTHDNIATIVETQQSDDASVEVHCYRLAATKNASTTFQRLYNWSISKTGSHSNLTLAVGEQYNVSYDVTVDVENTIDSNWEVQGSITVSNPNPSRQADLTGVVDSMTGAIGATVNCPASFVAASSTLVCTYNATLPDGTTRTNTATATQQNYDFASDSTPTNGTTTDYSGTAQVTFGLPSVEIDKCINVTDDQYGDLGVVCSNEAPKLFSYELTVGPYELCGLYEFNNTASFVAMDTQASGSDSWTVGVNVPCETGCTLTQGYWKTHSDHGPAPYDDNWANVLPNGSNTTFYYSGKTYYQVLKTPPSGGNAYYQLAHQYIAAYLNVLNGASNASVVSALNNATALFSNPTYTPTYIGGLKSNNAIRKQFNTLAGILGSYNEGAIGPGHCDEQNPV